jgi:hypothetical protein
LQQLQARSQACSNLKQHSQGGENVVVYHCTKQKISDSLEYKDVTIGKMEQSQNTKKTLFEWYTERDGWESDTGTKLWIDEERKW